MIQKPRIIGVATLAILGLALAFYAIQKHIVWRETGTSVQTVPWLPNVATNISYTRTNNWRSFEFDIPENEFREWAQQYALIEIDEPFYIERYNYSGSLSVGGSEFEFNDSPEFDPSTVAILKSGLKYHQWSGNRGGVSVGFDQTIGRAYFHSRDR